MLWFEGTILDEYDNKLLKAAYSWSISWRKIKTTFDHIWIEDRKIPSDDRLVCWSATAYDFFKIQCEVLTKFTCANCHKIAFTTFFLCLTSLFRLLTSLFLGSVVSNSTELKRIFFYLKMSDQRCMVRCPAWWPAWCLWPLLCRKNVSTHSQGDNIGKFSW